MATYDQTEAAQETASQLLADDDNVVGIGVERLADGYGLRVNVENPSHALPAEIDDVPVSVRVVGRITARSSSRGFGGWIRSLGRGGDGTRSTTWRD